MLNFRDQRHGLLIFRYLDDCILPKVKTHGCFQLHVQIETAVVINFSRVYLTSGWTLPEHHQRGQDFWWHGYHAFL